MQQNQTTNGSKQGKFFKAIHIAKSQQPMHKSKLVTAFDNLKTEKQGSSRLAIVSTSSYGILKILKIDFQMVFRKG